MEFSRSLAGTIRSSLFYSTVSLVLACGQTAFSSIAIDGTIDADYGSALATQTVNTGFGDSTSGNGTSNGGSEFDAAYGVVEGGDLYLFLSGNFENNGNHINLFIADGRAGGQNTLEANTSSGILSAMNGSIFSPGFNATYALDLNDYSNTLYIDQYNLINNTGNYLGGIALTGGIGSQTLSGVTFGLNDTNAAGVNGTAGTAANGTAADAVTTGLEFAIPLSALGNPTGNIEVMADINNNNNTYLSNQFLPGLSVGAANVGSAKFNLSAVSNAWFSVAVPSVPNGSWLPVGGGSWTTAGNWSNSVIPNTAGGSVDFSSATGPSVVTLDGTQTAGSISFNSTSAYTIASGTGALASMLVMDSGTNSAATITDFSGSHTISAPMGLNTDTGITIVSHGDKMTLSGNISGAGGLDITNQGGSSDVLLQGSNSWAGGTTVSAGNLQLGSSSALPVGTALTLSALDVPAGVLDLNGNSATVSSITVETGPLTGPTGAVAQIINTSTTPGVATFTYAGSNGSPSSFSGKINDKSGTGGGTTALNIASGSLTLSNTNTYGGATTINGGATLALTGNGTIGGSPSINVNSGGTFDVTGLDSGFTVGASQSLANDGSVLGSVLVSGSLSGSGTLNAVSILSGGMVAPGDNGTGILNTGSFTLNSGAQMSIVVQSGTDLYNAVQASSSVTLGGALNVTLASNFTPNINDKFFILINSGGDLVSGTFSNIGPDGLYTIDGAEFQVNYADSRGDTFNDVSLTFLTVPEPGEWMMLLGGFGLLVGFRRGRGRQPNKARAESWSL